MQTQSRRFFLVPLLGAILLLGVWAAPHTVAANEQSHPSFFQGISQWFRGLFGKGDASPAPSQSAAAAAGLTELSFNPPASNPDTSVATTTIINQYVTNNPVIERIIERAMPVAITGITPPELDARIKAIDSKVAALAALVQSLSTNSVSPLAFAQSQRIDQLTNVIISNPTLTDADIPDNITASSYLPLSGGMLSGDLVLTGNLTVSGAQTFSGALALPYLTATSTATSSFAGPVSITAANGITIASSGLPQQIATLPDGGYTSTYVVAAGNYLYGNANIGSNTMNFAVYDISNPANPRLISASTLTPTINAISDEMHVSGHYVYMVSNQGPRAISNIIAIDVSNPQAPRVVQGRALTFDQSFTFAFDVVGKTLYASNLDTASAAYNISDPLNISSEGFGAPGVLGHASGLKVRGDFMYTVDVVRNKFIITDISQTGSMKETGSVALTSSYGHDQIALSGNYAYTTTSGNLSVINIADPTAPSIVTTVTLTGDSAPHNIYAVGRSLFLNTASGIAQYDISSSTVPTLVGIVTSETGGFNINGRYLYTTGGKVFDLGGSFMQNLNVGANMVDTLDVMKTASFFGDVRISGGLAVGPSGLLSNGSIGVASADGATPLSVTAATSSKSTGRTSNFTAAAISNYATSSTASIIKSALQLQSTGSWTGTNAKNIGLYISSVSGGTNNYDAIFNGGGSVGIGTTTPWGKLSLSATDNASIPQFVVASSTKVNFMVSADGRFGFGTTTTSDQFAFKDNSDGAGMGLYDSNGVLQANIWVGQGATTRNLTLNTPDVTGTGDNNIIFRFNGPNNKFFFADTGSVSTMTTVHPLYLFSGFGVATATPAIVVTNLQNNQNIGLGTTTPYARLSIQTSGLTAFVIASSTANSTTTLMAVTNAGKVSIGTTTPIAKLEIWGDDTASTTSFLVANSASTSVFAVYNNGNATYSGSIFQSSDQRLKENIQSLGASSSLAAINALNPVAYTRVDQPEEGTQLGFIAQAIASVFPSLVKISAPTPLTPGGTFTVNYPGLIAPLVKAVQALSNKIDAFADHFQTEELTFVRATGDEINVQKLCVGSTCVTETEFAAMVAAVGQTSSGGGSGGSAPDTTAPVITITGANPAHVNVGDSYADLGASVTDNVDQNLAIHTYVDGVALEPVVIDTSIVGEHSIDYVATDTAGNAATSTRTVIVE